MNRADASPYLLRLLITGLISLVMVAIINEGAYLLQKENYDRPPKTIQLTIPAGTSERVAAGEEVDALPSKMVFVVGDVLEVKNEDIEAHQLGPVWVPPGATGRLELSDAQNYMYTCSYTPSRYMGLEVRQSTTMGTRLTALALSAPPTMIFLFIYSLVVYPIKPKQKEKQVG